MNILISFIVPVYKVERIYLEQCLNSLMTMKCVNVEFILIDDGSPDRCGDICDHYSTKDCRFKTFHKLNEGVSIARNYGIKKASGKYISFIDADDWIDAEKMDDLIEQISAKDYDVVVHGQYIDYRNSESIAVRPFEKNCVFSKKSELINIEKMVFVRKYGGLETSMGAGVFCNAVDKIIKKKILKDNDISYNHSIKIGEDALFNLQVINKANTIFYFDKCIYHYRMRKTSANHCTTASGYSDIKKFAQEAEIIIRNQDLETELLTALFYRCFDLIFEQMNRCYLQVRMPLLSRNGKLELFKKDMHEYPFKQALERLRMSDFQGKYRLRAILFKYNMGVLFLMYKEFKWKIGLEKRYERKMF